LISAVQHQPCGDCHRCCQGHLWGEAYGHQFRKGKPCGWLGDQGCLIYPNHPQDPCKSFVCGWKSQGRWPAQLRPDKSNVIFVTRWAGEHRYWHGVNCSTRLDHTVFDWALQHHRSTGENLVLTRDQSLVAYTREQSFLDQIKLNYPNSQVIWQS
jgi:hypothetical protein